MKGSKPLAFLKIFGRGCLPECIHLTALLGTIFLVIFICDSATARTLSERASITGNVSFQGKAVDTDLDCAIALKEGDDIGRQDTPTYSVRLGPEGSFAISGLRKTLYTLVILPLNPSLEFEYVQLDGQLFQGRQLFRPHPLKKSPPANKLIMDHIVLPNWRCSFKVQAADCL